MPMCSEGQVNGNSCTLVLESVNFPAAFESRLAWLDNQVLPPQSPVELGIDHEEIKELKFRFPAVLSHQRKPIEHEEDLEYLELWATPSTLYRDPQVPHYSLYWSLENLVKGNPFQANKGLSLRSSYFFVDQDDNRNLLVNGDLFEFRTQALLEDFMFRYRICRLFVNPDRYNIKGDSIMTCITQRTFWEARIKDDLVAVAKQYGICDANHVLRFVSIANGLLKSNARLSFQQLATMIKNMEDGYL